MDRPKTSLVVDDKPNLRPLLHDHCGEQGVAVLPSANGHAHRLDPGQPAV